MTVNELNWWYAYNLVCYLKPERDNFFNSTQLSAWCDKSPNQLMVDFFSKKYDKEYQAKKDKVLFDELTEMSEKVATTGKTELDLRAEESPDRLHEDGDPGCQRK